MSMVATRSFSPQKQISNFNISASQKKMHKSSATTRSILLKANLSKSQQLHSRSRKALSSRPRHDQNHWSSQRTDRPSQLCSEKSRQRNESLRIDMSKELVEKYSDKPPTLYDLHAKTSYRRDKVWINYWFFRFCLPGQAPVLNFI
jgi:hypothetical protein